VPPSPAERPPGGPNWIHEIKHDGYRLMARRDAAGR
jgi:ATP-dependent DNA ligase